MVRKNIFLAMYHSRPPGTYPGGFAPQGHRITGRLHRGDFPEAPVAGSPGRWRETVAKPWPNRGQTVAKPSPNRRHFRAHSSAARLGVAGV
jgi:hypothetical protein